MPKRKQELVVKDNRLVEASYRLTLVEQQIVLYSVFLTRENEGTLFADHPVTIRASDFVKRFGGEPGSVYGQLKEAMNKLFTREATLTDIDPDTKKLRVIRTRWISQAAYIDGAGNIQVIFAPAVIPYITRILGSDTPFTKYRLDQIAGMSSAYAIRLYELLEQYRSLGKRSIEIDWLVTALQVPRGTARIDNLKKFVIEIAIDQINEHTDLDVTWTQRKTGVKVTHFEFTIKAKTEVKPQPKPKKKVETIAPPKQTTPQETAEQIENRKARAEKLKVMRKRGFSKDQDQLDLDL